jgi:DNA-binding XRE family transcriptional regulator
MEVKMRKNKAAKLMKAGWKVGSASDFLGLSEEESAIIDMKISLSKKLVALRKTSQLTQVQAAKVLHTSQSRIAKMESGDPSVSIELLIKGMIGLGASKRTVGQTLVKA